ncbi:MAG: geranylgeranyl reductase family protein [Rhodospirillales bacterium]|nr:geranylgeranyl reductase family protein [Rhodospirillales bacterium]
MNAAALHDVIVVGAGPGGAAAASFLAGRGMDVLVLDKADFPREKVCGDGLTPQAIAWLDRLGCAEEVLAETKGCIKACDLYINGRKTLSAGFPQRTLYPDFAVLLDRRRFDHILLRNALANGAQFRAGPVVRGVSRERGYASVFARSGGKSEEFRGRIVIGADGVSSAVSRAIGNRLKTGVMAVSVRAYFTGVKCEGAPIKVYFDRSYFPGYGWLFADETGFANIGLGYALDPAFPLPEAPGATFRRFLRRELAEVLSGAERLGAVAGGSSAFFRPDKIFDERVMLVGDAANQADPLNGGGIHKAMESAFYAARAAEAAFAAGDFSRRTLALYRRLWESETGADWQTAELFLTIAKNPAIRDFCLLVLERIGRLTAGDAGFRAFAAGVFSGVLAQRLAVSPAALRRAFPKDLGAWQAVLRWHEGERGLARRAAESFTRAGGAALCDPMPQLGWGFEVASKALRLAEREVAAMAAPARA